MRRTLLALMAFLLLQSAASAAWPPMETPRPRAAYPGPYAPYAGSPNHAHAAPSFQWGWFGAESYAPLAQRHRGYYGIPIKWSNHRW